MKTLDPLKFVNLCWPEVTLYDKQIEIFYSVRDHEETFVKAGHELGKDFVSALIALWFFISRRPARVVTTSVKHDQLNDVLWGEIRRFIETSKVALPIQYNHMHIRQVRSDGSFVSRSELVGQVINKGESLLGRHLPRDIPRTLVIFDEASGIDDAVWRSTDTWAHRKLVIGNPYPCENFFKKGCEGGNINHVSGKGLKRKVMHIRAEDSPNVKHGLLQKLRNEEVTPKTIIPGLIDYEVYLDRRQNWDLVMQTIGLDAEFYKGKEVLLFPPEYLNACEKVADDIERHGLKNEALTIGVDSAEGGDDSAWCVMGKLGVVELVTMKTSDTTEIVSFTIDLKNRYKVDDRNVIFDRGGGGKQHADRMRSMGYMVRTISFGESISLPVMSGKSTVSQRRSNVESRLTYKNRRAEIFGLLSNVIVCNNPIGIPRKYQELRRQLSLFPKLLDGEGRLYLPSKRKKSGSHEKTLEEIIGRSPDDADAFGIANWGVFNLENQFIGSPLF
jgi:hypothetical protein